jgi:hypothetical protein
MPNYYRWGLRRLRNLLVELKTGGVGMKDMLVIRQIENLIWEKENA